MTPSQKLARFRAETKAKTSGTSARVQESVNQSREEGQQVLDSTGLPQDRLAAIRAKRLGEAKEKQRVATQAEDEIAAENAAIPGLNREADLKDYDFSAANMVGNIPGSAYQLGKDIVEPLLSPWETAKSVGNLALGTFQKLTPGIQEEEAYADAVGGYMSDRYGGIDNLKRTLQEDPIGLLSDVAGVATGGAAIVAKAAKLAKAAKVAKVAKMVGKVGMAIDPFNLGFNAVKPIVAKVVDGALPANMMKQVVKTSFPVKNLDANIDTMLREQILPNAGGINKRNTLLSETGTRLDDLIDASVAAGDTQPGSKIFENLPELTKKLTDKTQTDAAGNLKKINDVKAKLEVGMNGIDNAPVIPSATSRISEQLGVRKKKPTAGAPEGTQYTTRELNDLKRSLYEDINFDVKQQKADPAVNQARKNIANKTMKMVEDAVPEAKDLNKRMGDLLELGEPLDRAARRIEGRDAMGIGVPIKGAAAEAILPGSGWIAAGIEMLSRPQLKARQALWLNKVKSQGLFDQLSDNNKWAFLAKQGLLSAPLFEEEDK